MILIDLIDIPFLVCYSFSEVIYNMPRAAREKSHSGIYHVMLRGINKQNIFEESEDYGKFLKLLEQCMNADGIELYGYCLMTNHVHLLLKESGISLEIAMKRIASKYAVWFNTKYQRVGHLFQDRFKSEPVEDPPYFLTVLRYIHFNPVEGKLVKAPSEYLYSSYNCYFGNDVFVDTEKAFSYMPSELMAEFHAAGCSDVCLDVPEASMPRLTEEQALAVMRRITKCESSAEFQALPREKKNQLIKKMKAHGVSIRQISRTTGETYYLIQKV